MALNPLIILLLQGAIIKMSLKLNDFFALSLGFLLFGISFFILNYPVNMSIIFLSCTLMTFGEILGTTYAQSIAFGYAPVAIRGRILGLYKSIYSFAKIIGTYLAGGLIYYASYNILWNFCGMIGLLGSAVILTLMFKTVYSKNNTDWALKQNP